MSFNIQTMAGTSGNDFGHATVGAHYGRLVGFVYAGIHSRMAYQGQPKDPCGQILVIFELTDDFIDIDGVQMPRWITRRENAFSTSTSNLVKLYNALDPSNTHEGGFDKLVLATTPCLVNVAQRTDIKGNLIDGVKISSITALPEAAAATVPAGRNPIVLFDFDSPTAEAYDGLKPWMRKVLAEGLTYSGSACEQIAQQWEATQQAEQTQPAPVQTQPAPVQTQPAPVQTQPAPVQTQPAPVQTQPAPVQTQPAPVQTQPAPVQTQPAPVQTQPAPVQTQPAPVQTQPAPVPPPGFVYDAETNTFKADEIPF